MRKILINSDYGGFCLSDKALDLYEKRTGSRVSAFDCKRDDPILIEIVETLGVEESGSRFSTLKIVEIPDDVDWIIQDYDGEEWIAENHRTWS